MAINGLGYHYYQNGGPVSDKNIGGSHKADFRATVAEVSFSGVHRVAIDPEALFSICDAATGESANVYRAEGYSGENPLYLVKGIDENGNEYEQTIDVSKVNPNHCSYRELLALNAHTGNRSDGNFLTMSVLKDKMKNTSYEAKTDYLSAAYALMKDMQTVGCWNSYMRYDKWISDILSIGQKRTDTWYNGSPLKSGTVTEEALRVDTYRKYLESKYGKVTIKDVPKDQKTLEKLGKSMGGNDVVIAPNILEEMAKNPEKAVYYEQKIDYFFDTIIPRETARCASMGLVFEPAGVVVHKDGTVTYICGCSDSPERVAQVNAINKAKREKQAARREEAFEHSREAAERLRQEIELSNRRHSMEESLNRYNSNVWEAASEDIFYMSLGLPTL